MNRAADTWSWIECEDYGAIDRLESEAIVTEFFLQIFWRWQDQRAQEGG